MINSAKLLCYSSEKYADEVKGMKRQLPKNIRQIGNVSDNTKIYVEDYVDTFLSQLCEKADQVPVGAFLVGEVVPEEDETYIYVYGAVRMQEVLQKGREIQVSESTWKNACETCKEYFGDAEILGWFITTAGQALEVNHNLLKVHQKLFPREKSIFVIKEAREKEEKYFTYKYRDLLECAGHYIYYEKNIEMQNYMISTRKKLGMTPSEVIEDTVTKNFRSVVREKMIKNEQQNYSRFTYALSTFLVLVVLVIGVTMINNYDKMKGVQDSLDKLSENMVSQEKEEDEAIETVGTIIAPDEIEIGEKLEVPQNEMMNEETSEDEKTPVESTESNLEEEFYVVKKGDTLASISKKVYGDISQVEAICKMNGLEDGNLIFIGQKLLLP